MKLTKSALPFGHPATLASTWFGSGLLNPAPGTWGSAAALPFGLLLAMAGTVYLLAGIVAVTLIGVWASDVYGRAKGVSDTGEIVIDEVAGQWIVLLAVPIGGWSYLVAFGLFRLFDITKPWPANWCDRNLKGGVGVMTDDLVAGVYAMLCALGLRYLGVL